MWFVVVYVFFSLVWFVVGVVVCCGGCGGCGCGGCGWVVRNDAHQCPRGGGLVLGRQLREPRVHGVTVTHKKRKQLRQVVGRHVGRGSGSGGGGHDRMNAAAGVVRVAKARQPRRADQPHARCQRARWRGVHAQNFDVLLLPDVVKRDAMHGVGHEINV